MGIRDETYAKKWFEDHDEELAGGWDAIKRDQALDGDGVAAEVVYPDADAVESRTCVPFGAGPRPVGRPRSRARDGGGQGPQPVAGRPVLAQPGAAQGRGPDPDHRRARRRAGRDPLGEGARPRRGDDPGHVGRSEAVSRSLLRPGVGAVRGARDCRSSPTRVPRPATTTATISASTSPRSRGGRPARCGSCSGRVCSPASPGCASASPRAAAGGSRGLLWSWDRLLMGSRGRGEAEWRRAHRRGRRHAPERDRRSQLLHRPGQREAPRARSAVRDRHRRTCCGAPTSRTPRARGRTPTTGCRRRSSTSRSTSPDACSVWPRATPSASTWPSCAPISDKVGPTPTDLGQLTDDADRGRPHRPVGAGQGGRPALADRPRLPAHRPVTGPSR